MREGFSKLNFTFKDLSGKPVSINDARYKNKVVIIQLMGSWCANCLDETKFLSDYYQHNHARGVEVIALAYELTTERERSKKSIEKFQKLFNVQYPMLITGVAASDEQKTEKTLPQLTLIKSFPTTIFIDKNTFSVFGVYACSSYSINTSYSITYTCNICFLCRSSANNISIPIG